MFHTQGKDKQRLTAPIATKNPEAWLGEGIYFWYYEDDATWWGSIAKKRWIYYEVYTADIDCKQVLDTVFNEEHYNFWIDMIEKAIKKFLKGSKTLSLKYLNDFFKEKGVFEGIDGVMFQDISENPDAWIVKKFQYKKRIQLVAYNPLIISNFAFRFDGKCV